jgi:carbon starvation protein CstA
MDHVMTAKTTTAPSTRTLLVLVIASLACAPVSWIVDGVTPSFVVYPIALLIGLWRRSRGGGTLYFGIAGTIFLLIHLPFTWASVTGADTNPANHSLPAHPVEWLITLFLVPLATAIVGFVCWRQQRH